MRGKVATMSNGIVSRVGVEPTQPQGHGVTARLSRHWLPTQVSSPLPSDQPWHREAWTTYTGNILCSSHGSQSTHPMLN